MRKDFSRPAVVGGASPAKTTGIAAVAAGPSLRRGRTPTGGAVGRPPAPHRSVFEAPGPSRARRRCKRGGPGTGKKTCRRCRRSHRLGRPSARGLVPARPEEIAPGANRARSKSPTGCPSRRTSPVCRVCRARARACRLTGLVTGRSSRGADPRPSEDKRVIGR